MRRPLLVLLPALVAGGCDSDDTAATGAPPAAPESTIREPTPYLPELDAPPPEAALSAEAINAAVAERLPGMARADVSALPDLISSLVDFGDPDCPGANRYIEDGNAFITVETACTAADGVEFRGFLNLRQFDDVNAEGVRVINYTLEASELAIAAPDGRALTLTGYIDYTREMGDEETAEGTYFEGLFQADPATVMAHPWLGQPGARQFARYLGVHESGNVYYELSTVATFDDPAISAIKVDALRINTWVCDQEPLGGVSIRETNGVWHDLMFDGFSEAEDDEPMVDARCDGCAAHLTSGAAGDPLCGADGWLEAFLAEVRR